jgi:hypothetical protein
MFKVLSRLAYFLVVIGCFLTVGAGYNTTPPFNECPAIGLSPSCAVLYVFNANGTVSVYGDASVSPYDGSEDTLVGVLNNSSQTIPSLTLSGVGVNGIPIFELEGDGICTYAPFTGSGYCSGAYYKTDPGDYAGPNQTITNISSDQKTGTINFIGGLAPGAATYFSLEDRLSTSAPPVVGGVPTTPAPPSVVLMLTAMAGLILYQGRRWFAQMFA